MSHAFEGRAASANAATTAAPRDTPAGPPVRHGRRKYWIAAVTGFPAAGAAWMVGVGPHLPVPQAGTFAAGVLVALMAVCTWTDLARRKIYNWATYTAFLAALALNGAAEAYAAVEGVPLRSPDGEGVPTLLARLGAVGLASSLLGAAVCFFALLVVYQMSGFRGAGDVKLATATGAWLGVFQGLTAILYTYAIAGAVLASWLVLRFGPVRVIGHLLRSAGAKLLPGWVLPPLDPFPELKRPVPMSAFFAAGAALVLSGVLLR